MTRESQSNKDKNEAKKKGLDPVLYLRIEESLNMRNPKIRDGLRWKKEIPKK